MSRRAHARKNRGFAIVALVNPKTAVNVGHALRAVGCFNADALVVSGIRYHNSVTDTCDQWKDTPFYQAHNVFDLIPKSCVPIAVDLVEGATELSEFTHPERGFYVFGPEDSTLGAKVLDRCAYRIKISTNGCLNLAACVNVVLYDRMVQRRRDHEI